MDTEKINAEVISVFPNKIKIAVEDLENFQIAEEKLKVGSYLRISDNENAILIAIIENFSIEIGKDSTETPVRKYILEANPLGIIRDGKFERGDDSLAIPPKQVEPAKTEEIEKIFTESIDENEKFTFASLSTNHAISVPVNGNKFFNKHIAIVGSTGSGKSHSIAKILQEAIHCKNGEYTGLNNSHIVIFDIHSEYKSAFPTANYIDISTLVLPYWMLTSDELQELFIDTEVNDHNQRNVFKQEVIQSRKKHFTGGPEAKEKIHFDSPLMFDLNDVLIAARDINKLEINTGEVYASGPKKGQPKTTQGSLYGKLTNFINRLENKLNDKRLDFLLGDKSKNIGVNQLPISISATSQFRAHIVTALATTQKAGQKRHIAARFAIALGFVHVQHRLYSYPVCTGDNAGMFPHCHNPIFHRANLSSLARALERAVVGHNTVLTVKLRWLSKKVYVVLLEILIRRIVSNHINRICQNTPDGKACELLAALCDTAVL